MAASIAAVSNIDATGHGPPMSKLIKMSFDKDAANANGTYATGGLVFKPSHAGFQRVILMEFAPADGTSIIISAVVYTPIYDYTNEKVKLLRADTGAELANATALNGVTGITNVRARITGA